MSSPTAINSFRVAFCGDGEKSLGVILSKLGIYGWISWDDRPENAFCLHRSLNNHNLQKKSFALRFGYQLRMAFGMKPNLVSRFTSLNFSIVSHSSRFRQIEMRCAELTLPKKKKVFSHHQGFLLISLRSSTIKQGETNGQLFHMIALNMEMALRFAALSNNWRM